jgi:hypothetical protein
MSRIAEACDIFSHPDPRSEDVEDMEPKLDQLARKHGSDKGSEPAGGLSGKGYTATYSRFFEELRQRDLVLLEIGVASGASLRMWEEYFPNARIFGVDVDPDCTRHESDRTRVIVGDQADAGFLQRLVDAVAAPFDIVIDDGGHHMCQHQTSLEFLFPHVTRGGLYCIEDLHTSYRRSYGGGFRRHTGTIEYLKALIDHMNRGAIRTGLRDAGPFGRFRKASLLRRYEVFADLDAVHLYKSLAVLRKR